MEKEADVDPVIASRVQEEQRKLGDEIRGARKRMEGLNPASRSAVDKLLRRDPHGEEGVYPIY